MMRIALLIVLFYFQTVGIAQSNLILTDSTATKLGSENHHCYRYVFMQSGINLPKKNLYYHNFDFLWNDFQYGLTDNLNVGGGIILPFFAYISPKLSIEVAPKQHLLMGDIAAKSFLLNDPSKFTANVLYGGYSYGNEFDHATVSMGYFTTSFLNEGSLMFNFGGSKKLAPTVYLVGEFWINPGTQTMKNVSTWDRDQFGNKQLVDPSDPLHSMYKVHYENVQLNRTTVFANIQLRLISNKNDTKSWSFGLAYYSNWGGHYIEEGFTGDVRHLSNYFSFPVPSISFSNKIGKVEPDIKHIIRK